MGVISGYLCARSHFLENNSFVLQKFNRATTACGFHIWEDFTAYADVCFREFGDRVLCWTTINEANLFAYNTYRHWRSPHPSYYSPNKLNRSTGYIKVTSFDPYLIAHHALLAHASVARLY